MSSATKQADGRPNQRQGSAMFLPAGHH